MKTLHSENPQDWENKILKDLVFIKKHSRYPISKKTLAPTLFIGFAIAFILRFLFIAFMSKDNNKGLYIILSVFVITLVVAVIRYIRTIKFTSIPTDYFVADNQPLLKKFFEEEHLAYFRHPQAPEVFQIISRSIFSNSEQREVMVFIADDKRILINSHFTAQKFSIVPSSKHYRSMARMLKKWIETQNFPAWQGLMTKTD